MSEPQPSPEVKPPSRPVMMLQGGAATALLALAVGVGVQQLGPVTPPKPDDPVVSDIAAIAESALIQLNDTVARSRRDAGNSGDWRGQLRRSLPDKFEQGLLPVGEVLEKTRLKQPNTFPQVFRSVREGFDHGSDRLRRTLHDPQSLLMAKYGNDVAAAFATAAQMATDGATVDDLHDFVADANHNARDRLIALLCGPTRSDDSLFTGYLIDDEDRPGLRDTSTSLLRLDSMPFTEPDSIDPHLWHRVENQGNIGACQGWALSSVEEMLRYIASGGKSQEQFSAMFCYRDSQIFDGLTGDVGSTIAGGLRSAKEHGACPEAVMPYPRPVRYSTEIPQRAYDAAKTNKVQRHTVLTSYAEIKQFLASGQGGVLVGVRWPEQWMECHSTLEVFIPGNGGHAVCFLGYSGKKKDDQGRKYLWMANSWGKAWGDRGFALVSPYAVDQMCKHKDTAMVGLSDMTGQVRPRDISWIGKGSVF